MKSSSLATKLIIAALFLAILAYAGFYTVQFFTDPYRTTVAYAFTSEHALTVSGYVVRTEEVLPGGGELVYSARNEGERVSAGGAVALIYQSAQSLDDANALRSLEEQLEQLQKARSLASGTQATARLDDEVRQDLMAFRESLTGANPAAAADPGEALRSSVLQRSYAYSGTEELDASIASLQDRVSALSASADAGTTRITAPRAGLFSGLVDGYEAVLSLEAVENMTPSGYRAIQPQAGAAGVGKMVYGERWAFVCLMGREETGLLTVGDTITLRFQTGLSRDMKMRVHSMSVEEDGMRVVVFDTEHYLSLTTLLRRQNAQVILDSYTGIRVPRSAVRVEQVAVTDEDGEPVLDSSGEQRMEPVTCVYSMWGEFARRKPVKVLWQEEEYILVEADQEALAKISSENTRESRRLRVGDPVIIAAADIFDGMVVR